jgi:hypothetical protein
VLLTLEAAAMILLFGAQFIAELERRATRTDAETEASSHR